MKKEKGRVREKKWRNVCEREKDKKESLNEKNYYFICLKRIKILGPLSHPRETKYEINTNKEKNKEQVTGTTIFPSSSSLETANG